jgi:hypothetical protein
VSDLTRALCIGCSQFADELEEYIEQGRENDMTPEEFVRAEEGTYNRENGHFLCTACYIAAGSPSSPNGWIAP